ncbi:hypothetical protein FHS23_004615 [Prauserella isguenensis]|uniref:Uncharacterized protein n=1 Tax=Prauserella isguenensis TaxID=1470180 RepID=A0A839S645_9PSEU|nr:hypothetical protein [Prauserella isguenensis]MBB3053561.1 hypothetical protein [Prauserella isguenensis]
MTRRPACSWCDLPATHTQVTRDASGRPESRDYACGEHTDQWLRPMEKAVFAGGSYCDVATPC